MGKNKKKDELWKEAYRRCRLSVRHIQMAMEAPCEGLDRGNV